jgi:nucleotide-binding universal stress UspA family protein
VSKIDNAAKDSNVDYVVMGTKGSTNSSNQEMGSITAAIIYRLECPVLAISEGATF